MLADNLSKEELKDYAKKAYNDKRIDFFSMLADSLSNDELKEYIEYAYDDSRIDFFNVILVYLDKEDKQAWKTRANPR